MIFNPKKGITILEVRLEKSSMIESWPRGEFVWTIQKGSIKEHARAVTPDILYLPSSLKMSMRTLEMPYEPIINILSIVLLFS